MRIILTKVLNYIYLVSVMLKKEAQSKEEGQMNLKE